MKKSILIISLILLNFQLQAQKIKNYDQNGHSKKTVTDYVVISVVDPPVQKSDFSKKIIEDIILGPVYTLGSELIKKGLEKRQKSFTATYSQSNEIDGYNLVMKEMQTIIVKRYAINSLDDINDDHLVAQYTLALYPEESGIYVQLKQVLLRKSKAKYKSGNNLNITIHIKATAKPKSGDSNKTENKSVESEGTITIPVIKVSDTNQNVSSKTEIINRVKLDGINISNSESVKFSYTITETNINHINPSLIQTVLTSNSDQILSILKSLLGTPDK